jgi:type VI secretion system protein ImpE
MQAEETLKLGDLPEALAQVQEAVRNDPSKAEYRTFLFQLLCVMGQWERAINQLNVVADLDGKAIAMAQVYRQALNAEAMRAQVFAGQRSPLVFGQPAEWMALLLEALKLTGQGEFGRSQELRNRAFEIAPATAGKIDDQPFEWIADADPRLGPCLEAIINGKYYWVPFDTVHKLDIEAPSDLRDVVWMPGHIQWTNGGEMVALFPTRYPQSEASEDSAIRLARKTDWVDKGDDLFLGLGQRLLATDAGEFPLMDTRKIEMDNEIVTEKGQAADDGEGDADG